MSTPKYAGPSVIQQLCALARDAAYSNHSFCLIAAAEKVGRALSGAERQAAQECYRSARAEMEESLAGVLDEIRLDDERSERVRSFVDRALDYGDEREIELYEDYP